MAEWSWPNSSISRVLDGDTVEASVTRPIGFGGAVTFPVRLRLNRINAARSNTAKGRLAKARVLHLTTGVRLDIITLNGYKYGAPPGLTGEWMAEVLLPGTVNLSDLLVAEGLAVHWDGAGPRPADE